MDELKILVWIVIGIVYLLARKKKKTVPPASQRRVTNTSTSYPDSTTTSKPMTFEDLLREIEGAKKPQPIPEPVYQAPKEVVYDYDDVVTRKPLEDTDYDYRKHDKIYEEYETAKKYAFVKPSLEETMKIEDTVVRFNQFKEYEPDARHTFRSHLLNELKNPQSFKKAFIMSEILKKKF